MTPCLDYKSINFTMKSICLTILNNVFLEHSLISYPLELSLLLFLEHILVFDLGFFFFFELYIFSFLLQNYQLGIYFNSFVFHAYYSSLMPFNFLQISILCSPLWSYLIFLGPSIHLFNGSGLDGFFISLMVLFCGTTPFLIKARSYFTPCLIFLCWVVVWKRNHLISF